jgi:SagB-type dehydrogenase family enzyme
VTRRSRYAFDPTPLELATLSTLLHWALGVQRTASGYGSAEHPLGMAPSAGGLPSLRVHLVVGRAGELEPGIYEYLASGHTLSVVALGIPPLQQALVQPQFADLAPTSIILSGQLTVVLAKYPPRHYRTIHVDAGVAIQNLYLVSTALNLASCAVAGYYDTALAELLELTPDIIPLMVFPVGHHPR